METVFVFKGMSHEKEAKLREHFLEQLPKFEKILNRFPSDAALMHVKGEKFIKHSACDVELTLKLPKATLTGQEASHMITKAVDLACDRLNMQMKKSILSVRREHRGVKVRSKAQMRTPAERM